jgi:hypothetical protein
LSDNAAVILYIHLKTLLIMSDEELRIRCIELSVECFSWFKGNEHGIKGTPIALADLMYQFVKTGKSPDAKPYYPQPL